MGLLPRMICPRSQNGTMNNISKAAPAPMANMSNSNIKDVGHNYRLL